MDSKPGAGGSKSLQKTMSRKVTTIRKNLFTLWDKFYNYFMYFLYYGGIQASVLYGFYTRPPLLMHLWYNIMGDEENIRKLQNEMMPQGGMM